MPVVLDASAYLAYTLDEPGATEVETAMVDEAIMSAVNLAEVLSKMADRMPRGARPPPLSALPGAVTIEPFTDMDALKVAELRFVTRRLGLSLGDRACIALGHRLRLPVLTADQVWAQLDPLTPGVPAIRLIR